MLLCTEWTIEEKLKFVSELPPPKKKKWLFKLSNYLKLFYPEEEFQVTKNLKWDNIEKWATNQKKEY